MVPTLATFRDMPAGAGRMRLLRQLVARPSGYASAGVLGIMALACCLGPSVLAWSLGDTYAGQNLALGPTPPSLRHVFGTDFYGRDLLVRVLAGGQISLACGLFGAIVAALVGTAYGACAGFGGGQMDRLLMRAVDVIDALPYMFLVIILVTVLGKSLWLLFVALGLVSWLSTARLVRAQVMALMQREFVHAAQAVGAGPWRIVTRHVLPNALGPITVSFTLCVPAMIMQEAFLSFLGLGVQAPRPSLGALISDGAAQAAVSWWALAFPAAFLALLLACLNVLGDTLRDVLDRQQDTGAA